MDIKTLTRTHPSHKYTWPVWPQNADPYATEDRGQPNETDDDTTRNYLDVAAAVV